MANPGNKEKLIEAAQQLAEKGQFDKALREYLKVAAEDEHDVLVWVRIGDLYVKLGQKSEAVANYQRVAQLYIASSQPDKAIAVYQQILQLDPKAADTYMSLGSLYRDIGKAPLAMQQFELAAQLYTRAGKNGQSLRAEQAVVDLAPESLPRRIRLAELYSKENLPSEAAREFRQASLLLKKQGRMDDWAKVVERLLFHEPSDVATSNELARHYLSHNDGLKALSRLQSSFKENRQDAEQLDLLSQAFVKLQKPDKAIAVLKELARLTSDRKAAESVFRKVLAIDANDVEAKTALGGGSLPSPTATQTNFTSALILNSPSPGPVPASKSSPLPASATSSGRPTRVVPAMQARTSSDITPVVGVRLDGTMPPVTEPVEPLSDEEEQERVLSESDSYVRFGLKGKALESLRATLSHRPHLHKVREKLSKVYEILGQFRPAIAELRTLADRAVSHEEQARYLREILRLDNRDSAASEKLRRISGEFKPVTLPPPDEDEPVIEMTASDDDGPTSPNPPVVTRSEPQPLPPAPSGPNSRSSAPEKMSSRQSAPSQRSGTLREELAEVEFFLQQRMLEDAKRLLRSLASRYPHSQTVQNKLAELGGSASSSDENLIELEPEEIVPDSNPPGPPRASTLAPPPSAKKAPPLASARSIPVPPSGTTPPSGAADKSGPIGEARDPNEAYQRGIAHRNRGQHALAIGEFKVAMQERKLAGRAALMLGQCYRDLSQLREAVEVFKEGLYMPSVSEADLAELNYQLAQCYERLQNHKEAIYFYQQAQQSQPGYKDAAVRVNALRR